jgi:hypothetical protein
MPIKDKHSHNTSHWYVSKMRKATKLMSLPAFGILIVLVGFVYDISFAGIPYQDPDPVLQAQYDFHSLIASLFYKSGGVVFLFGLISIPVVWKKINK